MVLRCFMVIASAALAAAVCPAEVSATNASAPHAATHHGPLVEPAIRVAQAEASDLMVRLDRLEAQIRQLTGAVEQLQYRNQQLEQQVHRIQGGGSDHRPPESGSPGARHTSIGPASAWQEPAPGGGIGSPATGPSPQTPQRRAEVFDPKENPNAPGAPRSLGQLATGPPPGDVPGDPPATSTAVPGGRPAGAPLDLGASALPPDEPVVIAAPQIAPTAGPLPPPPARYPNGTQGQQLVMAPSATPKDEYDLAYGYVLRKDYALAEESFRAFLRRFPEDRLVPEATYWLGESLFQRQRYREAAESFLTISTRFQSAAKAPESLLRLGQSLAALGEKDAACASFGQVGRKYPRAGHLRQPVEREQKRVGC